MKETDLISDRQIAKRLEMSYDTLLRWKKEKPRLYHHIKEGFILKQLALEMDEHLQAIFRQTRLIRLRDHAQPHENRQLYQISQMRHEFQSDPDAMPLVWTHAEDRHTMNILTVEDEILSFQERLFINLFDYQAHSAEDGTDWLLSTSIPIHEINDFFDWYFEHAKDIKDTK